MNQRSYRCVMALLCLVFLVVGGCNPTKQASAPKDDHDHDHDHPAVPRSLPAAMTELRDSWAEISTAMNDDDPDSAHEPLHDVGRVLEAMPELAAETDLPESEWNEIKEVVDQLFDAFGKIDSAFHKKDGDKVAAYESVKSTIDEGVASLEAKLPILGADLGLDDGHQGHAGDDLDHDHDHGHSTGNEDSPGKPSA